MPQVQRTSPVHDVVVIGSGAGGGTPGNPDDDWHRAADELRPKGDRIF